MRSWSSDTTLQTRYLIVDIGFPQGLIVQNGMRSEKKTDMPTMIIARATPRIKSIMPKSGHWHVAPRPQLGIEPDWMLYRRIPAGKQPTALHLLYIVIEGGKSHIDYSKFVVMRNPPTSARFNRYQKYCLRRPWRKPRIPTRTSLSIKNASSPHI